MPTALITGANRGIGLELARQYAGDGWTVIGTAREPDKAADLAAIDATEIARFDAADAASIDALASQLGNRPIDVFINNAGYYGSHTVERQDWLRTLAINTVAPTQLALRLKPNVMAGESKKMVVLTSKMGSIADNVRGGAIIYRSSKAAVNAAWKSLAIDFASEDIAITMLHPGWVRTDMGGPNALIDVETSVSGLRAVIDGLSPENSGCFLAYDGSAIDW